MKAYKYIIILTSFFFMSACEKSTKQMEEPTEPMPTKAAVVAAEPEEPAINDQSETIAVRGYVDVPPANKAAVSPYFGGFVKQINVLPGQEVQKGDVLFILENPEYLRIQQEYLESKEQLSYLKSDFDRQEQLASENIASTKNAMKAATDYKVMLSRYQSLKEQLKLMGVSFKSIESGKFFSTISIKAPISGSVTDLMITNSAFADAQEVAIEIINSDHIHLELDVFEHDAMKIQIGQRIQFTLPEMSNELFEGEVYLVGNYIEPNKRTIKVHGHIHEDVEANFLPGMYIDAKIIIE